VVAVNHKDYLNLDENYFRSITKENPVLLDIKGIYRSKMNDGILYWSL
jgi:UDP-N-acetyl-D-galactosamine dehydrogenase